MKRKLTAVLICLTMCVWLLPVISSAEDEWAVVDNLLVNEKAVYTGITGELAFDKSGAEIVDGLFWDGENYTLTMNNVNLKSVQYRGDHRLTVELAEDNTIASDIEPTPDDPEDPGSLTKKPALDIDDMVITGSGNLDVSMLVDCVSPKHFAMECETLELSSDFTGELSVRHDDLFGPSMHIENFNVYGGRLYTNSEIDAINMVVDGGDVEVDVEKYSSCGICTGILDPKDTKGSFRMNSGHVKIVNHQDVFPDDGIARGIWSGQDIVLDSGLLEIYCDEEAIFNESAGLVLNGGHLTCVSDETVAVRAVSLNVSDGDADLTGKDFNVYIDNKPVIDDSMSIFEPANGSFEINKYGNDCYCAVDENGEPTRRVVVASKNHNVSFSGNGGMWGENPVKIVTAKYFEDEGCYHIDVDAIPAPYLQGYSSAGWTDQNGDIFTFGEEGTVIPEGGFSGCVEWTPNWYVISYDGNGGSGNMADQMFVYDEEQRLSKNAFTKKGFRFAGWKCIETGKTYADRESIMNLSDEFGDSFTFQAQWKPAAPVLVKAAASGSKAIKLSWNKTEGAEKYIVYGQQFGKSYKKLKTTGKTSCRITKIKGKKLKAHKVYKFYVKAVTSGGADKSKDICFIAGNTMGKYANAKSISVSKKKLTLKPGNKVKLKVKTGMYNNGKHIGKRYGAATRFISVNPAVAKVNAAGSVTAQKKGTTKIYIQDIGGRYCSTSVTVTSK